MGYYAEQIRGEAFTIPTEKVELVLAGLEEAEGLEGHISWCDRVSAYRERNSDAAGALAEIISDFGFETEVTDSGVFVEWWRGEKIGMSWDAFMAALAPGVVQPLNIVMRGEDDHYWAEVYDGEGHHRQGVVYLSVFLEGREI